MIAPPIHSKTAKSMPQAVYEQQFRQHLQELLSLQDISGLYALRLKALSRFEVLGFPTRRLEAWKNINLRPLLNQGFVPRSHSKKENQQEQSGNLENQPKLAHQNEIRLIFVDGQYQAHLTPAFSIPGLHIHSVKDLMNQVPSPPTLTLPRKGGGDISPSNEENQFVPNVTTNENNATALNSLLEQLSIAVEKETDAFAVLNTVLFEEGIWISVDENVQVEPLIHFICINTQIDKPVVSYPCHGFHVGANASLRFVIEYRGLYTEDGESFNQSPMMISPLKIGNMNSASNLFSFNNALHTLHLANGAKVDGTMIFNDRDTWQFATTRIHAAENASISLNTITLGGNTTRHHIHASLEGEGATVELNGLDVLKEHSEVYHPTVIDHQSPNTQSHQFYKGILDGHSQSEFNGLIVVDRGAHGTDAKQLNRTLLLSDDARVWTRPQLNIEADDVKCAHGASVGQLDHDQLFYLASRGLDHALAQALLTYGFADEILQKLPDSSIRQQLETKVLQCLYGEGTVLQHELGEA